MKKVFSIILISVFTISLFFSFTYAAKAGQANRTYVHYLQDCYYPAGDCFDDIIVTP